MKQKHGGVVGTPLSATELYLAGGISGIANTIISGPMEHLRIRLQTQPHGQARLYSGPLDCMTKIVRQAGITGLYRGQSATIWRDFHNLGIWFTSYELFVGQVASIDAKARNDIAKWKFAVCGGLAGIVTWLLVQPLDVIKSRMQSDGFGDQQKYKNLRAVWATTLRNDGVRGLFHGLTPALLRAFPVSAGTFVTCVILFQVISDLHKLTSSQGGIRPFHTRLML